ncbi:decarboxylase [Lithospermum erythrorhizon]|uniref:Decarboxylase n=1 Tax=Lithospermum erythrorhizon TaxID=34254 RepID=A0AAV3RX71_LITER
MTPSEVNSRTNTMRSNTLIGLKNMFNYVIGQQRLACLLIGVAISCLVFSLVPSTMTTTMIPTTSMHHHQWMTHRSSIQPHHHQHQYHHHNLPRRVIYEMHGRNLRGEGSGRIPLGLKRKPMVVLVTGGAGFVGSHLVDRLIARGDSVIVVDNFFTGRKRNVVHHLGNPKFELIRHDVVEPILLEVDQIYHLACPASPVHYKFNPVKTIISFNHLIHLVHIGS